MSKRLIYTLILSLVFTNTLVLGQQKSSFEIHAPKTVEVGQRFMVLFIVSNAQAMDFPEQSLTGFKILAGPIHSTSNTLQVINGINTNSSNETYSYTAEATSIGNIEIAQAQIITKEGEKLIAKAIQIQVVAAQEKSQKSANEKEVDLRMEVDKSSAYNGETITASLMISTKVGIVGIDVVDMPSFDGFSVYELQCDSNIVQKDIIDGMVYNTYTLKKWLLYPNMAGQKKINATELKVHAQKLITDENVSLFDNFFNNNRYDTVTQTLLAPSVKIMINELPKPYPDGFSGIVGNCNLEIYTPKDDIYIGKESCIIAEFTGSGDFWDITKPVMQFPDGIQGKEMRQSRYARNDGQVNLRWEFPFIATKKGEYSITPLKFIYFDLQTQEYATLSSGSIDIKVIE